MKKTKTVLFGVLALSMLFIMIYSGWQIWKINAVYTKEAEMHEQIMVFKPDKNGFNSDAREVVNQAVVDLKEQYPDSVGWITIPNTNIDYPFVWSGKDDGEDYYYLRRDIDGNYAMAGTLFIDSRCEKNFTSQNTVIYGHNMKNGSMFGTLKSFALKSFFDMNFYGVIYLPNKTLALEFFAYMVINPDSEKEIYKTSLKNTYLSYVEQNAKHYRDIGLAQSDRIVTLSSCAYDFDGARMVLLARVSEA